MKWRFGSALCRVYSAGLVLLPARLRTQRGEEMRAVFGNRLDAALGRGGAGAGLVLLGRELMDIVRAAWTLRHRRSPVGAWRAGAAGRLAAIVAGGVRQVRRSPSSSALALVVMALGIACTTSIFVLVNGVALRPLAHRDPASLVIIGQTYPTLGDARVPMSWPNYEDLRASGGTGLSGMAAFRWPVPLRISVESNPEIASVSPVSGGLFDLLGNRPVLGRGITESDEQSEARVAVLDDGYWRTRLGGDHSVLGRTVAIEGEPYEIVGVMAPAFEFPTPAADLFVPMRRVPAMEDRDTRFIGVVGRLAEGISLAEARLRMDQAMDRLVVAWPEANEGNGIRLDPLRSVVLGNAEQPMKLLLVAVVLLLVLSCVSIANLLLARTASRSEELAVRRALGAGRGQIAAQLLVEGLVLALAGGTVGLLLSVGTTRFVVDLVPSGLPRLDTVGFDVRAFGFAAVATIASGLLFAVAPALRGSSRSGAAVVRRTATGAVGASGHGLLQGLVSAQVAITVMLLIGGGLMLNSFLRLVTVDSGLDPDGVVTLRVGLTADYQEAGRVDGFFDELVERASAQPGVEAAGATWALPFTNDWASGRVTVEGAPRPRGEELLAGLMPVRGRYFAAVGMRLLEGRLFESADYARSRAALSGSEEEAGPRETFVVINRAAARAMWPGARDVVGRRFRRGRADEESPWITVIGVVADAKRQGLSEPTQPEVYQMHPDALWARDMSLVARTDGDAAALAASLTRIVHDMDPGLAVRQVGRLGDFVSRSVDEPRFRAVVVMSFAVGSLILALAGVYGVLSFAVSLRTREIGIRMALGAGRGRVLRSVLIEGAVVVSIGLGVGLLAAGAGAGVVRSQLFGIGPFDAPTWLAVTALMVLAGLLACWLPAARAARVAPAMALRD